jgi:hypothetical protein
VDGILTRSELANGHCAGVPPSTAAAVQPKVAAGDLTTLDAMASLASHTGTVVHVVVARGPGIVERAHALAQLAGIEVNIDLMPRSVHIRFDGRREE